MNKLSTKDVLNAFFQNTSNDFEVLNILREKFEENGLYDKTISVMGGDQKQIILKGVTSVEKQPTVKVSSAIGSSAKQLNEIYKSKKTKLNLIYWLTLVSIIVSISLITIGLVILFRDKSNSGLEIITAASSAASALISGTALVFYDKIRKGTDSIENEIIKLEKLNIFFELIDNIPNDKAREIAYSDIIKQMN